MTVTPMIEIPLLPHQYSMIEDTESKTISCVAGLGSGKTTGAVYKALDLSRRNPPTAPGVILLPTYPMARDVARPAIDSALAALGMTEGVDYEFNKSDSNYFIDFDGNGSRREIRLRNGESGHRLAGSNLGWAVIDEAGQQKSDVLAMIAARIRHPDAVNHGTAQLILCGTPEGFNAFYRMSTDNKTRLIKARTTDNTYLGPDYIERLSYFSDEEKERYINGEFVALSGSVYTVKRDMHVRPCANPGAGRVYMCCDFNIGCMAWVLVRELKGELHAFSEIVGENRNTLEMTDVAVAHLAAYNLTPADVTVICDAAGAARQTSASMADTIILRQQGFRVNHPARNPPIKDRVYAVNAALKDRRLYFDPNGVPNTLAAFEQQGLDRYGMPDKSAGHDHYTDAVGYGCHWLRPVAMPRANNTIFYH